MTRTGLRGVGRVLLATFWNASERRLRAPWRLALGLLVLAILGVLPGVALALLPGAGSVAALAAEAANTRLGWVLASGTLTVVGVYVAGRSLDRRRFVDFGLRADREFWLDAGFGLALGAALFTLVFLAEWAAGWLVVTGTAAPGALLAALPASLALFLAVGIYEELLVRGYLLKNVLEGVAGFGPFGATAGAVAAAVTSSAVFGLLHAGNPNATTVSVLTIAAAGLLFALAYLWTGRLGLPIGLHASWNFVQGPVYGFPVSGIPPSVSVLTTRRHGPTAITGGEFGPEAGILGLAALLVGAVALAAWVRARRGELGLTPGVESPDLRWR